jgi:FkbM family methyltransferase
MGNVRFLKHVAGLALCNVGIVLSSAGNRLLRRFGHHLTVERVSSHADPGVRPEARIWIDVGAHRGETTLDAARRDPSLVVYAFEPNIELAAQLFAKLPNYVVIAQAISDVAGYRKFNINSDDATSSLLDTDTDGLSRWHGVDPFSTLQTVMVPTARLDTFIEDNGIDAVERLKIDAQGHDLEVLRSAGDRIGCIEEIIVEVRLVEHAQYHGATNSRDAVTDLLVQRGFAVARSRTQNYGQEANLYFRRQIAGASASTV